MTGFFTAEHILGQQLILVKQDGQVGFGQGFGTCRRLLTTGSMLKLVEAQIIRHVEQVVGESPVLCMGEGAAHIVALVASGL